MIDHKFVVSSTGAQAQGRFPESYAGVSIDSRTLRRGELFFALKGQRDGHDYVESAFAAGAGAAVVERNSAVKNGARAPLIRVDSASGALGEMALQWRKKLGFKVVCITGSNGKTTTTRALETILKAARRPVSASRKSFNNHLGLPLTFLQTGHASEVCVAEVGISAPGEMMRLQRIAEPDVGAITGIGTAHIGNFGSGEKIAEEKSLLFSSFGKKNRFAVNLDDPLVVKISNALCCEKAGFSVLSDKARVFASKVRSVENLITFTLAIDGRNFPLEVNAAGAHNVVNFACAAALSLCLEVSAEEIAAGITAFQPERMRMEVSTILDGVTLINDCYNANPNSVDAALEEVCRLKQLRPGSRAIAVIGDMLELGGFSPSYHREAGKKALQCGIDFLLAFGTMADDICAGAKGLVNVEKTESYADAADIITSTVKPGDFVLIKGSRGMKMENIARRICGR